MVSCGELQSKTACYCNLRTIATAGEGIDGCFILRKIATLWGGKIVRNKTYNLRNWQLGEQERKVTLLR